MSEIRNCLVVAAMFLSQIAAGPVGAEPVEKRFTGVSAGVFHPDMLSSEHMHWVSDGTRPILTPREGQFRNIYAPSLIHEEGQWAVYYGGWDGIDQGNDKIYRTTTQDFRTFGPRRIVIENGNFQHVCNVNALRLEGSHLLTCTSYPDSFDRNKPIAIHINADSSTQPITATPEHQVDISGYPDYRNADVNGMSVMLRDEEVFRMYFCDFKEFGRIYHAQGSEPHKLAYTGVATKGRMAVNDVKIMRGADGTKRYLMGLHMNHSNIYASVSDDPTSFPVPRVIATSDGDDDKYIVAVGWVVEPGARGDRLLGMLYGAGAVSVLDKNRIFAKWLQKKPVPLDAEGQPMNAKYRAEGPDVVVVTVPKGGEPVSWKVP